MEKNHFFLEKKGEGIHHVAFAVDDIVSEIARLKQEGFQILNETPKKGADNKLVAFLPRRAPMGFWWNFARGWGGGGGVTFTGD